MLKGSFISLCIILTWSLTMLICTGCGGSVSTEIPGPAVHGPGPEVISGLPGLPDPTSHPRRSSLLFAGEFSDIDEYKSSGATWDMEGARLRLDREGLSYSILGTLSPVYNDLSITLDGELDGVWLGISDYPRGSWRWLDGPLTESTIVQVPPEVKMSPAGMLYVALVCPEGSSAAVSVSRSFAYDIVRPPEGLDEWPVVPEELLEAYAEAQYADERGDLLDFINSGTLSQRRAVVYHLFTDRTNVVFTKLIVISQPCERDDYLPLINLIKQQINWEQLGDYYLGGMHFFVLNYHEERTRAELAWTADWMIQQYPGSLLAAEPVTFGGPPP